ncbi:hypothetical protein STENM327S_05644 [Streptomyces tendae]
MSVRPKRSRNSELCQTRSSRRMPWGMRGRRPVETTTLRALTRREVPLRVSWTSSCRWSPATSRRCSGACRMAVTALP